MRVIILLFFSFFSFGSYTPYLSPQLRIKKEIQELEAEIKKREHDLSLVVIPYNLHFYHESKRVLRRKKNELVKLKKSLMCKSHLDEE